MSDQQRSRKGVWGAVVLLLMLVGTYVGGYSLFSETPHDEVLATYGYPRSRHLESQMLCRIFRPLAWCECRLTGRIVILSYPQARVSSAGQQIRIAESILEP